VGNGGSAATCVDHLNAAFAAVKQHHTHHRRTDELQTAHGIVDHVSLRFAAPSR
jgi:hypothetical protein